MSFSRWRSLYDAHKKQQQGKLKNKNTTVSQSQSLHFTFDFVGGCVTEPHCAGAEERNGGKQWSVSEPCRAVLMVKSKIDMYKCIYYTHFNFFVVR